MRRDTAVLALAAIPILVVGAWLLEPWFLSRFVLAFVGSPLTSPGGVRLDTIVGVVGVVGLTVNAAHLVRRGRPLAEVAARLSLAAFVALPALLASVARGSRFGLGGAVVPRYSALAALFWVAYAALAVRACASTWHGAFEGRGRAVVIGNTSAALLLVGSLLIGEVRWARRPVLVTRAHEECLLAAPRTGDVECLRPILPGPPRDERWVAVRPHVLARVRRLAELGLGPLRRQGPGSGPPPRNA